MHTPAYSFCTTIGILTLPTSGDVKEQRMSFLRFVFSFLYTRNWHTGQMEISTPRLMVLIAALVLFAVATGMIAYLQTPIVYHAP